MAIDVPTPNPPDLSNRDVPSEFREVEAVGTEVDFRREELEESLRDGAWQEAFTEWAAYTDLSESEFEAVRDLGLTRRFDFFWDSSEERLRFDAPSLPDDVDDDALPESRSGETRTTINTALEGLGQTTIEVIADGYLEWGAAEPSDYVWDGETFGEGLDRGD